MKKIAHHPDVSTLMTCAAGSQPEALCAVVASHLAVCPKCMSEVSRLEKIGVALFEKLDPEPVALDAPLAAVKTVAESASDQCEIHRPEGDVPAPLVALIGPWLDQIDWRPLGADVWHFPIALSKTAQGDLRLVKISPGLALPKYATKGEELALVLRGKCRDDLNTLGPGDFIDRDTSTHQVLRADDTLGCILLIATDAGLRFGEPQLPPAGRFS